MSTLTVQLPDDLKAQLARAARRAGKSPARFVRDTLEQRLKTNRQETGGRASLFDLSRDLCGSVKGGPSDLSSNKKHMAGYGAWKK
jgi:plasmid stability protein